MDNNNNDNDNMPQTITVDTQTIDIDKPSLNIPVINLPDLYDYVKSTIETKNDSITIYHFIIGSNVFEPDFRNCSVHRNHEFPKVVENLLIYPESQLSPEFISSLSHYNQLTIVQKLILIDPYYKFKPEPIGLISKISGLSEYITSPNSISLTHHIKHNEFKYTNLTSKIEIIITPDYVNEQQILSLLRIIKYFSMIYPILVNIMDCSSIVATNIYCDSILSHSNNWCNVSKPYCLLDDNKIQFLPILTMAAMDSITDASMDSSMDQVVPNIKSQNIDSVISNNIEQFEQPSDTLFTYNKINVRWINYVTDSITTNDLKIVYDYCAYSFNTYKYLTTQYKILTVDYSMYSLYKLWGYTTYTNEHTFNDISSTCISSTSNKTITVNMSKLSFFEFASYWKINKNFRNLTIFNSGFDIEIINKFIDNFVNKYINKQGLSYLGINPSVVDILKIEAFEIFTTLIEYFPSDKKYISDIPSNIQRNLIREYLVENDVKF